jgi:hypothetical protein
MVFSRVVECERRIEREGTKVKGILDKRYAPG